MLFTAQSYYSLRYGCISVEQVVKHARLNGLQTLAFADVNNTSATTDFVRECNEQGIRPVAAVACHDETGLKYLLLARNNQGFREINDFLSEINISGSEMPERTPELSQVFTIYPISRWFTARNTFYSRHWEFIGIRHWELNKLITSPLRHHTEKLLAWHNSVVADTKGFELHRHLRAIDCNSLLSMLPPSQLANPNEVWISAVKAQKQFIEYSQLISNSKTLLNQCELNFDFRSVKNKRTFTGSRYDDRILLEKLAIDGLSYRYGSHDKEAMRRIKHELEIIDKLGYSAYFLITWDMIRYSMSRGFYHVGRGSGANSIVAYCLRITDVDPISLDLYFERFINPLRTSPPDFDIDYSWKERDEVLDYIFKRYGHKHTALLGAMSTFKGKSILRELGKVYGLPKSEIDNLVEDPGKAENQNQITRRIMAIGVQMTDFPNIRSIHAGGVLISEEPITCYTALDMPPKAFPTAQWDMYVAEAIGFEKLDVLSQRGLGHIDECVKIVQENQSVTIDAHNVKAFMADSQVKKQLRTGETTGCFYIESPAMRGLLKKLRCDDYRTLIAASSIIRPGVARSGMMKEYIQRFHNPNGFKYIHQVMEQQLKDTFGVMVYQEDVLKVCHHFAGLDLADADILRRAMSGKHRSKSEFERIRNRFFDNCNERGHSEEISKEVWRQIESFAGYSFSKAHSASYAVESFQSLYLKAHFPNEFHVAVINNFGGFYQSWVYFNEAKRCGALIELPCVNRSRYKTSLSGNTVYTGFIHIQNLENQIAQEIEKERDRNGLFSSLQDFVIRMAAGKEQLLLLIRSGAFRFAGKRKQQLLWEAYIANSSDVRKSNRNTLFEPSQTNYTLPELEYSKLEDAYDEIELFGFPFTLSHFDMLEDEISATQQTFHGAKLNTSTPGYKTADKRFKNPALPVIFAPEMQNYVGRRVQMLGNLVCIKYVSTIRKEMMHFGTFLDRNGLFFDTIHFPTVAKKFPFHGNGIYSLTGKIVEEFGFVSMDAESMHKLTMKKDPRLV